MARTKPKKPRPDFPLFPHASGQWAKTIRGKHYYFGPWDNPQAAFAKYTAERDDLYAGRTPATDGDGLTLRQLVNHFLTRKQRQLDAGEITQRSFSDYHRQCEHMLGVLGKNVHVDKLRPSDFEKLRADLAKTHGPKTLEGDIARCRALFNSADKNFDIRVKYGDSFDKPSRAVLRKHRAKQPKKMFTPEELRAIIGEASVQLRAMIYLGLNCGYGNRDCACLRFDHVDLAGGWATFPRPKTGILRRCPLWKETVAALRAAIDARPGHKHPDHEQFLFVTKYGNAWSNGANGGIDDPISKEFTKLVRSLDLKRKGVSFYGLRHVFQTVAGRTRDKDAVRAIMGHAESASDMSAVYTEEGVSDDRLRAVTDFVRRWLTSKKTR